MNRLVRRGGGLGRGLTGLRGEGAGLGGGDRGGRLLGDLCLDRLRRIEHSNILSEEGVKTRDSGGFFDPKRSIGRARRGMEGHSFQLDSRDRAGGRGQSLGELLGRSPERDSENPPPFPPFTKRKRNLGKN